MATTSPDSIYSPDDDATGALDSELGDMAASVQAAFLDRMGVSRDHVFDTTTDMDNWTTANPTKLNQGDLAFIKADNLLRYYNGSAWSMYRNKQPYWARGNSGVNVPDSATVPQVVGSWSSIVSTPEISFSGGVATVLETGNWLFNASIAWGGSASGTGRRIGLQTSNSAYGAVSQGIFFGASGAFSSTVGQPQTVTANWYLTAGDTVSVDLRQTSGGAISSTIFWSATLLGV